MAESEHIRTHRVCVEARDSLTEARTRLRSILQDEAILTETPIEASTAMEVALETIDFVLGKLKAVTPATQRPAAPPDGPTRQQGRFLAFIREYMMRNSAAVAPTHADFQRFFKKRDADAMLAHLPRFLSHQRDLRRIAD